MTKDEVLILVDRLKELEACENTLYSFQQVVGLCPVCGKAMLCYGYTCSHCGYDNSYSVREHSLKPDDLVYNCTPENGYGVRLRQNPVNYNFESMFQEYKFADSTPFGITDDK